MNTIKFILFFMAIFAVKSVYSHALWIESAPTGKKNQPHQINVYYGEYAEQELEAVEKWYSDLREFKLFLIGPDNKRIELDKTKATDHYRAEFTPKEDGTYAIVVVHPAKKPYETTAFEFSSIAYVTVGETTQPAVDMPLEVRTETKNHAIGEEIWITVFNNNLLLPDAVVAIIEPDGGTKTLKTDASGMCKFQPLVKGKYLLEVSKSDEHERDWQGTPIKKIWRGSTTVIYVN